MMDSAGIEQIKFGDSKFTDLIKGFEDKNNRVFGAGDMIDYGGVAFVHQDDPYRCNLPDVGGAVQTRCNTGKVRVGDHRPVPLSTSLQSGTAQHSFALQRAALSERLGLRAQPSDL